MKRRFLTLTILVLLLCSAAGHPPSAPASFLAGCASLEGMHAAERALAFTRLSFAPDHPGAQVMPACNFHPWNQPRYIVLHNTEGELQAALARFREPGGVSAHYLVARDGTVIQVLPESLGAYHASCGGDPSGCLPGCPACKNPAGYFCEPYLQSIGIELVNLGAVDERLFGRELLYEDYRMAFGYRWWQDYPEAQRQALKSLVEGIARRWRIPLDPGRVFGHERINHKTDPGPALALFWPRYGFPPGQPLWPAQEKTRSLPTPRPCWRQACRR